MKIQRRWMNQALNGYNEELLIFLPYYLVVI
jgi:hypothetical protein